jgi:hypothetical protein
MSGRLPRSQWSVKRSIGAPRVLADGLVLCILIFATGTEIPVAAPVAVQLEQAPNLCRLDVNSLAVEVR